MYFYYCEKSRQGSAGSPGWMGDIFYRSHIAITKRCQRLFDFQHIVAHAYPQFHTDGVVLS